MHILFLVEYFLDNKRLKIKAIQLSDIDPCHLDEEQLVSRKIKAYFLPSNAPLLIQLLDQGVLENLKRNSTKKLLEKLIEGLRKQGVIEFLKQLH